MLSPFLEVDMDINAIQDTIKELELGDTTLQNVSDLANLYIVRDRLLNTGVKQELDDILPAYTDYVRVKQKYQRKEISEGAVIKSLKYLCTEVEEFIDTLYKCTDMNKERRCIKDMILNIDETFKDR